MFICNFNLFHSFYLMCIICSHVYQLSLPTITANTEIQANCLYLGYVKLNNRMFMNICITSVAIILVKSCPLKKKGCEICQHRPAAESQSIIEVSKRKLEIYKALSSPAYILQSEVKDPILEAFTLSNKLKKMQKKDPSFKASI